MLESIREWFGGLNLDPWLENLNNEKIIAALTHPIGVGVAVAVIVFAIFMKWRITFVALSAILAGVFVFRFTLTDTGAPNRTILLFIGAAVAVAAFVIYFTLVADE